MTIGLSVRRSNGHLDTVCIPQLTFVFVRVHTEAGIAEIYWSNNPHESCSIHMDGTIIQTCRQQALSDLYDCLQELYTFLRAGTENTHTNGLLAPEGMKVHTERNLNILLQSYRALIKSGRGSVRAAWRFGQCCDSISDSYTNKEMALILGVSYATISRYRKFYAAFERVDLALEAAEMLGTYDIGLLSSQSPRTPARPLSGRHWVYSCKSCGSHEVAREEISADDTGIPA